MIVVLIQCDKCGEKAADWNSRTPGEARATARVAGFIRSKGRDLCPDCQ